MFFSIIIPVYNADRYLRRCLDSVLHQTYTNIEVIIINDGSTDDSGKICDEYMLKDNRCKVFHRKNGGVSSARNLGLDNATSEYIMFVDSDDWIETETVKTMFNILSEKDYDAIVFGHIIERKDQSIYIPLDSNYSICNDNKDILDFIPHLVRSEILNLLWNKVFKRSLIEGNILRFDKTIELAEDLLFTFKYFCLIDSCYFANDFLYHYENARDTSLTTKYSENKYNQLINVNNIMLKIIENKYNQKELKEALLCIRIKNIFSCFRDMFNTNCTYSHNEKLKYIHDIVKQETKIIRPWKIKNWKYKILAVILNTRFERYIYYLSKIINYIRNKRLYK